MKPVRNALMHQQSRSGAADLPICPEAPKLNATETQSAQIDNFTMQTFMHGWQAPKCIAALCTTDIYSLTPVSFPNW